MESGGRENLQQVAGCTPQVAFYSSFVLRKKIYTRVALGKKRSFDSTRSSRLIAGDAFRYNSTLFQTIKTDLIRCCCTRIFLLIHP